MALFKDCFEPWAGLVIVRVPALALYLSISADMRYFAETSSKINNPEINPVLTDDLPIWAYNSKVFPKF